MNLLDYYQQLKAEQKQRLADEISTSLAYLRHLAHGRRLPGPKMARRIEQATEEQVSRQDLRPDFYE